MANTFVGKPCGKGHDGTRYVSNNQCVDCSRGWYEANRERKSREYLERKDSIKERKAARAKQYYRENRERLLAQQKAYYESNKEMWLLKAHKRRAAGMPTHVRVADIRRLEILQRGLCAVCKTKLDKYHIDHIAPLSKGGKHEFENLQLLCAPCNLTKHAKDPITFMQSNGYLI
jgi:5-methylcytosine-specific restriction endonuclease McrA